MGRPAPATAPLWTPAQLRRVLLLLFGAGPRGGLQWDEAAAATGVGTTRIRAAARTGAAPAQALPAEVLVQLAHWVRPPPAVLRQELRATRYAREVCRALALPPGRARDRNVLPAWRTQRWLEPHLVAVVDLPELELVRVTVARRRAGVTADLRTRGDVIDATAVEHRFAAQVLKADLLERLDGWRAQAPVSHVIKGHTETWLAGAPMPALGQLYAEDEPA